MPAPDQDPAALLAELDKNSELGEWELVVDGYVDLAGAVPDLADKVDALREAAVINEDKLDDLPGAIKVRLVMAGMLAEAPDKLDETAAEYREVLARDAGNLEALDGLEAVYGEQEEWLELLDVYERQQALAEDTEARKDVLRRIAMVSGEGLDDANAALVAWRRVLAIDPHDEDAIDAATQIFADGNRFDDLVAFHLTRAEELSGADKADALCEAADVQLGDLGVEAVAIATYGRALEVSPGHRTAIEALERQYRIASRWEDLIEILDLKATATSDEATKLGIWDEAAALVTFQLHDPDGAVRFYEKALAVKRDHVPAIDGLLSVFSQQANWAMVEKIMALKVKAAQTDQAKGEANIELGRVLVEELGQVDEGLAYLELGISLAPQSKSGLLTLSRHFVGQQAWAKAYPLLTTVRPLLHRIKDQEVLAWTLESTGRCAEELLDIEGAVDAYTDAVNSSTPSADLLLRLARLCMKQDDYSAAEKYFRRLQAHYDDELTQQQREELTIEIGVCAEKLGRVSIQMDFAKAIEAYAPSDAASLAKLTDLFVRKGDWPKAIQFKQQQYDASADDEERFRLKVDIGDIYRERLKDEVSAIEAYQAALEHGTFSKAPLLYLADVLTKRKEFDEVSRYLVRLAKLETDPTRKARWLLSVAHIFEDQLKRPDLAAEHFEKALDIDPSQLEAFQALDGIYARAEDWKALERAYRRMIARIDKAGDKLRKRQKLTFMLYRNLGEIYQRKLNDAETAIKAYELALDLKPDDLKTRLTLARLCVGTPNMLDKAIANYRWLLMAHPDKFEHYHKLSALYASQGNLDRSWAVAGVLIAFDKALEAEERMYDKYRPKGVTTVQHPFDDDAWLRYILAEKQDLALSNVFAIIYGLLGSHLMSKPLKQFGIGKKHRIDLTKRSTVTDTIRAVVHTLGIGEPAVYHRVGKSGIKLLPTLPASLGVGDNVLQVRNAKGLAFHVARRLVYLHPWHVLAGHYDEEILHIMYMAAGSALDPTFPVMLPANLAPERRQHLAGLVGDLRTRLSEAFTQESANRLAKYFNAVRDRDNPHLVRVWHQAVELTAIHAALFCCNDVHVAGEVLKKEQKGQSTLSHDAKLRDFVMYIMSDRYTKLRVKHGVAVKSPW